MSKSPTPQLPSVFQLVLDKAAEADLPAEIRVYEDEEVYDPDVVVEFKRGRLTRRVAFDMDDAEELIRHEFGQINFLANYDAYANGSTGTIEALLAGPVANRLTRALHVRLAKLPGVENLVANDATEDVADGEADSSQDDEPPVRGVRDIPAEWHLRMESPGADGLVVEIGTSTKLTSAMYFGSTLVAMRITGADISTHDAAVETLERYGNAVLFELDLIYDIPLRLATRRSRPRRPRKTPSERVPAFPRNQYSQQSLALYQYGRSAVNLPLLEYLAYYQSIEHFFPYFAREQVMLALRASLLHPRFDPSNDTDVARILDLSANGGRATLPEREQLRATIRACIPEEDVRTFVTSDEATEKYFFDAKQRIRGVKALRIGKGSEDLRDQIADRIYALRCRIVHAKMDGGSSNVDVLLPLSDEADALTPDIDVVRLIAQHTLIGRAARS